MITNESSEFVRVGATLTPARTYPPETRVSTVADEFFREPQFDAVAVVEGERPIGLITRQKFLMTVFRRFGWELYARKPIRDVTDLNALVIPEDLPLDEALIRAVGRRPEDVYDELIVVGPGGAFRGLLSVRQMIIQHSQALANILAQRDLANARARELEELTRLKSQFLANVTHELRSPVNAIIELGELLRISAEQGFVGQMRDRLTLLLSSATNLRSIITNILDLSKIEAGRMEVIEEEFDLVPLLEEVAETTRVLLGGKPVDVILTAKSEQPMRSDPVKCRQVLLNLTSNAAKFTDAGRIEIEQEGISGAAIVRVRDTGIGIAPDDIGRVFEAFTQLEDAKSKRHQGTGLGLTIVRNLLELLGGSITVESEFGRGTRFAVTFPNPLQETKP